MIISDIYLRSMMEKDQGLPDWLVRMRKYYDEHGCYRPEDLRRLLGDSNRRVTFGEFRDMVEGLLEGKI